MSSIRSSYPMMFNTTQIPFPTSYSEDSQTIENTRTAEAGNDIVNVARYGKLKASMSFTCLQTTVQTLASFESVDSFKFKRYSPKTDAYAETTVRMRNFKCQPKKGSEDLSEVKGVWIVSFDLEEF